MSIPLYRAKARNHWETWLPKKTAELKAEGDFESSLQVAAVNANRLILELTQTQGYQKHEAEEVALKQYILLEPEKVAYEDMPLWEQELEDEIEEREREYLEMMMDFMGTDGKPREMDWV